MAAALTLNHKKTSDLGCIDGNGDLKVDGGDQHQQALVRRVRLVTGDQQHGAYGAGHAEQPHGELGGSAAIGRLGQDDHGRGPWHGNGCRLPNAAAICAASVAADQGLAKLAVVAAVAVTQHTVILGDLVGRIEHLEINGPAGPEHRARHRLPVTDGTAPPLLVVRTEQIIPACPGDGMFQEAIMRDVRRGHPGSHWRFEQTA
jgi:hypothetical protein